MVRVRERVLDASRILRPVFVDVRIRMGSSSRALAAASRYFLLVAGSCSIRITGQDNAQSGFLALASQT